MSNERTRVDWKAVRLQLGSAESALEGALAADPETIEKVYRQRAAQLAKRHAETAKSVQTLTVLVFSLGAEKYGIPVTDLAEVLPAAICTPVPGAASELAGVINLRGEIRSVVDLRRVLRLPPEEPGSRSRILMVRNGRELVGLQVGQVEKAQTIQQDELALPAEAGAEGSTNYFKGFSADKVIVIHTAALLAHPVFKTKSR